MPTFGSSSAESRFHSYCKDLWRKFDASGGYMRLAAIIQATFLCLASPPLVAQQPRTDSDAVTRVTARLREGPALDSRVLIAIPPGTTIKVSSCVDGWCGAEYQQFTGHVIQAFLRFPSAVAPTPQPTSGRGYTNSRGEWVPSPIRTLDGRPPEGASAQCRDSTFSFSRSRSGTCSHHGGVARWL